MSVPAEARAARRMDARIRPKTLFVVRPATMASR